MCRSRSVHLRGPHFSQNTDPSILRRHVEDSPKVFIFPHLRKIQEALSLCRVYGVKNRYSILFAALQIHGRFSARHTHFAEILNNLLIYSNITTRTRKRSVLTLILSFPKACFLWRIHRSNSGHFVHHTFYLDPFVLAFGIAGRFVNASPIVYVRRTLTLSINR